MREKHKREILEGDLGGLTNAVVLTGWHAGSLNGSQLALSVTVSQQ